MEILGSQIVNIDTWDDLIANKELLTLFTNDTSRKLDSMIQELRSDVYIKSDTVLSHWVHFVHLYIQYLPHYDKTKRLDELALLYKRLSTPRRLFRLYTDNTRKRARAYICTYASSAHSYLLHLSPASDSLLTKQSEGLEWLSSQDVPRVLTSRMSMCPYYNTSTQSVVFRLIDVGEATSYPCSEENYKIIVRRLLPCVDEHHPLVWSVSSRLWSIPIHANTSINHGLMTPCMHCSNHSRLHCSVCHTRCCSQDCQLKEWPIHKRECKKYNKKD